MHNTWIALRIFVQQSIFLFSELPWSVVFFPWQRAVNRQPSFRSGLGGHETLLRSFSICFLDKLNFPVNLSILHFFKKYGTYRTLKFQYHLHTLQHFWLLQKQLLDPQANIFKNCLAHRRQPSLLVRSATVLVLEAGCKPSTWLPRGRLSLPKLPQLILQLNLTTIRFFQKK